MAHTIHWVYSRRSDAIAQAILIVTLVQLLIGVAIVRTMSAQSLGAATASAVAIDRLTYRQDTADARLQQLDALRIPERLALLEQNAKVSEESWTEVRKLGYGIISGLVGLIATSLIQIRGQRKGRRET